MTQSPPAGATWTFAHSYQDILDLAEQATPYTAGSDTSHLATPHRALLKSLGIVVLGELEGTSKIVVFSEALVRNATIPSIDRMKLANVIQWFGEEMEQKVWSGGGDMPAGYHCTLSQVRNAIAAEAGKRQLNRSNLRGGGIWEVNGRLLLVGDHELVMYDENLQRSAVPEVDGAVIDFGSCEKWYDHEKLEHYLTLANSQQWREGVVNELIDLFARWDNWQNVYDPELTAALTLCTWLQTVWDWRPCLFVTGPTNSGKSMLLEETLPRLFGPLAIFNQKSSMAGLMQAIGQTAKIAILDEFESGKERKVILELVRTSGRGGKILRGTATQEGKSYGLKHIVWMGAIETGLSDAADRNRFILLHLNAVVKRAGDSMLQLPSPDELEDLGQRSLAVAVACWQQVKERAKVLHDTVIEGVDHRIVESYSLPCAMLGVAMGKDGPTTIGIMMAMLEGRDLVGQQVSDEQRLLEEIFESVIFLGGGKQCTVSQAVLSMHGSQDKREAAERCGVKSFPRKEGGVDCVFLLPNAIRRQLLKDSEWKWKQIDEIIARIPSATRTQQRLAGKRPYGWVIEKAKVFEMLGREYEGGEQPADGIGSGEGEVNGNGLGTFFPE